VEEISNGVRTGPEKFGILSGSCMLGVGRNVPVDPVGSGLRCLFTAEPGCAVPPVPYLSENFTVHRNAIKLAYNMLYLL
jgi:hypothetical protein